MRAAAQKGNVTKFGRSKCWIRDRSGKLKAMGTLRGKLYHLDCECGSIQETAAMSEQQANTDLWHQRLGHLNGKQLSSVVQKDLATGIKLPSPAKLSFCEGCVEGKLQRKPFKSVKHHQSTRKLELIYSDVCGPMQVDSIGGSRYFVTFIDDYSHHCAVYFLKQKSEVADKFKEFEALATSKCGKNIVKLRTDNGGEYVANEFESYLKSKGIQHEFTHFKSTLLLTLSYDVSVSAPWF